MENFKLSKILISFLFFLSVMLQSCDPVTKNPENEEVEKCTNFLEKFVNTKVEGSIRYCSEEDNNVYPANIEFSWNNQPSLPAEINIEVESEIITEIFKHRLVCNFGSDSEEPDYVVGFIIYPIDSDTSVGQINNNNLSAFIQYRFNIDENCSQSTQFNSFFEGNLIF